MEPPVRTGSRHVARPFRLPLVVPLAAVRRGDIALVAVVTDIGGPLGHSSIVAREYGIPAVLGTGSATTRIADGQVVTVDGDRGVVLLGG